MDNTTEPPTNGAFDYYGSGSFLVADQRFFLLTCCHNFLTDMDEEKLPTIPLEELEEKLTTNCQEAVYEVSDGTTFEITKQVPARDILALDNGLPRLYFAQVKLIGDSGTCA